MGLAASQAHLDLLTLRKSDLEYQIMQISSRRLQLTKDMEVLADEKARKLNNKKISVVTKNSDGDDVKKAITSKSLAEAGLVILDQNGEIVKTSETTAQIEAKLRSGMYRLANYDNSDFMTTKDTQTTFDESKFSIDKLNKDKILKKDSADSGADEKDQIDYVDWRTDSNLIDEYDTSDDEAATAKYDVETAKIKSKDQEFDLQQKTAETQQKAVTNEIDGVKKNIEKTIEMGFKLFA